MHRLADRVALVTGAGRGIGRATALLFAAEGARVVVNDLDAEPAHQVVDAIRAAGGEAVAAVATLLDLSAAREVVHAAVHAFGKLDILVNNAGLLRLGAFPELSDEDMDTVLNVNLKTAWHATSAAMPYLRDIARDELAATGRTAYHRKITFTGSAAALRGGTRHVGYAAAKGALLAVTRSLAIELGPYAINVNAVAPGHLERSADPGPAAAPSAAPVGEDVAPAGMLTALGRAGSPDDVARAHLYLCSTDSDYVTGVTLPVTGGLLGAM
jgi:3-oxoacyl-[acyl-carrier protein] reductase